MYKQNDVPKTTLRVNEGYQGERIEDKVNRITNNKEPITDGATLTYTERKDGVHPEHDVRTDKWEVAIDGMDYASRKFLNERTERHKTKDGKPEPTQAPEPQPVQ